MSLKEIIVRKQNREFNILVLKGFLPIRTIYFKCNSQIHFLIHLFNLRLQGAESNTAFIQWNVFYILNKLPVQCKANPETQTIIHAYSHTYGQFRITKHVFGLWDEPGVPTENPCSHTKNISTQKAPAGWWCEPRTFLLCGKSATSGSKYSPTNSIFLKIHFYLLMNSVHIVAQDF